MNNMSRRGFLGRSTALITASIAPIPKAMALVAPDTHELRWFAVGDEEYVYPYLAKSLEEAIKEHANSYGLTVGEMCPECSEPNCYEHNDDLDAPQPHLEDFSFEFSGNIPPEREPTKFEWMDQGVNVCCDRCDHGEPEDCYKFGEEALCCDCLEIAQIEHLDHIVGTLQETPLRQDKWTWCR